jgi:hypothetical protein
MYRSVDISTTTHIVILIIVARNVSPIFFAEPVGPKPTNSSVRRGITLRVYTRTMGIRVCQDTTSLPKDESITINIAEDIAGLEV